MGEWSLIFQERKDYYKYTEGSDVYVGTMEITCIYKIYSISVELFVLNIRLLALAF